MSNSTDATLKETESWDLIIKPVDSIFDLHLKDVWRYRDLLLLFVRRDFVSVYKQTILGPLWFFIQPLVTTLVFTFVFGSLAGIAPEGVPAPLFYLAGITAWNYFADCLTKTSNVFRENAGIFGKVYFPRLIMPLSIVMSNLIRFGIQMLMFVGMMIYFYVREEFFHLTWVIALFPLMVLIMALLGLGLGMITSSLTTKYRDLSFLVGFGVQLLMYGTTVILPLSLTRSRYPEYVNIIKYNPMTAIIESFRYAFTGYGEFSIGLLLYTMVVAVVVFIIGLVVFNKIEKNFVDTV